MRKNLKSKRGKGQEISSGSMADIAFLLLIFFLVTTTINSEKGIAMLLPPYTEDPPEADVHARNILNILVNSDDELLIEDEIRTLKEVTELTKIFVDNHGKDKTSSDSPLEAIVSIKTGRDTSYKAYIKVLDEVKRGYHELRAENLGITLQEYIKLDRKNPDDNALYEKVKKAYPLRISEAEPFKVN